MTAVKDNWLPDTKNLELLIDVEVRSPVGVLRIVQIGIAEIRPRVGIHAVSPRILRFRREGMRELMLEPGEQHVVVRLAPTSKGVDAVHQGVLRSPQDISESGGVIVVQRMVSRATL